MRGGASQGLLDEQADSDGAMKGAGPMLGHDGMKTNLNEEHDGVNS